MSKYYDNLKADLLEKYQDMKLEEINGSEIVETKYGETLKIVEKEKLDFSLKLDADGIKNDLTVIPNIGKSKEAKLKEEGFEDIYSLIEHERYCEDAKCIAELIEFTDSSKSENGNDDGNSDDNGTSNNSSSFKDLFTYLKKSKSQVAKDNILKSAALNDSESFKFMDIETLGLSNVPIILIGVAEVKGKNIESTQYLLRQKSEEPAVLDSFISHLDDDSVFVTYNGASFDVPFIRNRASYYKMNDKVDKLNIPHFDLLYDTRRLWRDKLPNCKLTTIEQYVFDIHRVDDVPGSKIPGFYETYLKEDNIGPLIPIIEHNRLDIVNLA
ncbi:MAG: ribonuclease H-like domain-containing protein, partial [Methanobacteriaceae archaeon]